jgi:hypothetical protein
MVIQLAAAKFCVSKTEIICHFHHFTSNSLAILVVANFSAVVTNRRIIIYKSVRAVVGQCNRTAILQVSRRVPTAVIRVWTMVRSRGICGRKVELGGVYCEYFGFSCKFSLHRLIHSHHNHRTDSYNHNNNTVAFPWANYTDRVTSACRQVSANFSGWRGVAWCHKTIQIKITFFCRFSTAIRLSFIVSSSYQATTREKYRGLICAGTLNREVKPITRGYNQATLFLGDIRTGTWPSRLGKSQMRQ